jgi:predicted amidohydrolase YtcJ
VKAALLVSSLLTIHTTAMAQAISADLLITNANVRTMDAGRPEAEAIAIVGNRIVAVGSDSLLRETAGPKTHIIDAGGRLVVPGFNDAHVHFLSGGFQLSQVNLRDADTPAEFTRRIAEFAEKVQSDRWMTGGDWDHERWPGSPLPTKELIDAATTNVPVFVSRLDGHMALANTRALEMGGVTRSSKDPAGGLIVRDRNGEPTGLLKDAAMSLVSRVIPAPTFGEKLTAARAATKHAASVGVTSVQDMSAGADISIYQELWRGGELKTRIYGFSPLPQWEQLARNGIRARFGSDMLRMGGVKGFADGSLGSTTALFFEPYHDSPSTSGLPADEMFPEGEMLKRVQSADAAGLQVVVHAIGDKANHTMLSIFEEAGRANGPRDRRFRIEHAQHLRPADISRFRRAGVVASMQPYHAADDGRWAEKRIGKERCQGTYAFRSLLNEGTALAFGSDWNVAPLDPMQGIMAAVTRRTLDGKHPDGWGPEQKITVEEAVRAYTFGSAYAEFAEAVKGTIVPGKLADIVILSRNIFKINATEIGAVHVDTTIVDGRIVFERR